MAFAFGHLIAAWIVGLLIQKIAKRELSKFSWALLLIGGILPDIDYIFGCFIHRTVTHSLLFIIVLFVVSYLVLKNYNLEKYSFLIPLGMLTHIILDLFTGPGTQLFYPLTSWISIYNTTQVINHPLLPGDTPLALLDMGLGFLWFVYLFVKNKINL